MPEESESRARLALLEGFCPDCCKPLEPREGERTFGWCPACRGYWVDGDIGLQVTVTSTAGVGQLYIRIDRCEHFRDGERRRFM